MHYYVTNTSSSNTTNATLLDSGNLILINNNSQVLWQSFDYPTDTLLPGMKLGYDNVTGVSWSLVSWNSSQDPAPGVFSLALDSRIERQQLNIKHGSKIYWTSDAEHFKLFAAPDMLRGNSTEKSNYVTADNLGNSTISRIVLGVSGQLKLQSWAGVQGWNTSVASKCGRSGCGAFSICNTAAQVPCDCLPGFKSESNDSWAVDDRRCVRKTVLGCNSSSLSKKDGFLRIKYADLPINPQKLDVKSSRECEYATLNNCSRIAYSFDVETGSCLVWDNDLLDLKQLSEDDANGKNFYLKLANSELNSLEQNPRNETQADPAYEKNTGNKKQLLIIVILTISLIVVTTLSFVMLYVRGKLRRKGEDLLLFDLRTSPEADSAELAGENQLRTIVSVEIYSSAHRNTLFVMCISSNGEFVSVTWDDDLRDSTISRIVLDVSGQLKLQSWTGGIQGCNSSLSKKDGFLPIKNADFPINPLKLDVQSSMECESASLSNCSWIAYAFDERSGLCF
ncbi:hypothetical protein EZV62_008472 [Acer yangbiense]|uniref:Apple domain-containing protein n=1 Tax=Acer yangbiense TaxID=1000413 RepID=A0A5C7ID75_9ROSI|nr:hypothetical protein EZV62_008472 [Acer yangbiense]